MVGLGRSTFLALVTFLTLTNCQELSSKKKPRLFSLFNVVTFPNNECFGKTSGDCGVCFTSSECSSKGGSKDGNCAAGFGSCCIFTTSTCGSTITNNVTYIQNPGYPSAYTTSGSCAFYVTPKNSDICQLRLDMDAFDLAEATTGACTDSFDVTVGSSREYYTMCGTNSGEHIYLETGRATSNQALTFTVASSATFKIKVSQIECFNRNKAPSDCYQYFTGKSGRAKSFNFAGGVPLKNFKYTACVRQEEGYCGIEWSPSQLASTSDAFDLSDDTTGKAGGTIATGEASYIGIPGSAQTYYSGEYLGTTSGQSIDGSVLSSGQRFTLEVVHRDVTQAPATGFDLTWVQAPCNAASVTLQ